jgi:hypothetical protein
MNANESDEGRGFAVVDKREGADADSTAEPAPDAQADSGPLPQVDFSSFCLSLATSALYHIGVVGDPESGEAVEEKNLPLAQQTIDALAMLQSKTQGNLDAEEAKLLDGLLYELRVRFVEADKPAAD